jgi:hypothetical protein
MPTEKEVLEGVLVKALNFTDTEVAALFEAEGTKEDALDIILDKRATVVQAEKAKAKKERDEQLMRGRKEGGKKWEDFLKSEGVELGDLTGESEDAFTKVKEHFAAVTTPATAETDEAKVKGSEIFKKREKELLAQIAQKDSEWATKWSERDTKENRARTLSIVKDKALAQFKAKNPILPKDETKAKNQLRLLEQELEGFDYELSEDGEIEFIKDKDGKRIETPQGNAKKFATLVEEVGDRYFEFSASSEKSSAGDPSKGSKPSDQKGSGYTGKKPANREQLSQELYRLSEDESLTPDARKAGMAQLKEWEQELS